nr:uncharacterized protein LOC111514422 [Leptinotarsa decemlineata]
MWIYQKVVCILVLSAYVSCYPPSHDVYAPAHEEYKETDYSFSYGVNDQHTGDFKHQWEKKNGDKVTGHYSLLEPDGSVRSVDYTADKKHGFNAVVKHSGPSHHPQLSKEQPISHSELNLRPKETHSLEYSHEPQYEIKYVYPDGSEAGKEAVDAAKYQEELAEQTYLAEQENNGKENYVFFPHEESAEESQQASIKSEYRYQKPQLTHNDLSSQVTTKAEYEKLAVSSLPVDLSLLKTDSSEKLVPVDVSLIKPIEVDVNENKYDYRPKYTEHRQLQQQQYPIKDANIQPSYELSQEELNKYLGEYYKAKDSINEPLLETGFKPVKSKPKGTNSQPFIPGTFKSNKKPMTTPGLSTYSSYQLPQRQANKNNWKLPKVNHSGRQRVPPKFPYQYFSNGDNHLRDGYKSQINRLYRNVQNSGYVRYARNNNS